MFPGPRKFDTYIFSTSSFSSCHSYLCSNISLKYLHILSPVFSSLLTFSPLPDSVHLTFPTCTITRTRRASLSKSPHMSILNYSSHLLGLSLLRSLRFRRSFTRHFVLFHSSILTHHNTRVPLACTHPSRILVFWQCLFSRYTIFS